MTRKDALQLGSLILFTLAFVEMLRGGAIGEDELMMLGALVLAVLSLS